MRLMRFLPHVLPFLPFLPLLPNLSLPLLPLMPLLPLLPASYPLLSRSPKVSQSPARRTPRKDFLPNSTKQHRTATIRRCRSAVVVRTSCGTPAALSAARPPGPKPKGTYEKAATTAKQPACTARKLSSKKPAGRNGSKQTATLPPCDSLHRNLMRSLTQRTRRPYRCRRHSALCWAWSWPFPKRDSLPRSTGVLPWQKPSPPRWRSQPRSTADTLRHQPRCTPPQCAQPE
mmetsp:Transcript_54823/g.146585  ORF Transcript_54823/g.146585 Transcript_54823/m.146585 type:complete len:231 (-) Transcript_54823:175-867(-)